jgi:heptosyltransferase-2
MNTLIIKLGATGDVVRTSALLHRLRPGVTWVTAEKNASLLQGLNEVRVLRWEDRDQAIGHRYELIINLEDTEDAAVLAGEARAANPGGRHFGARLEGDGSLDYTEDSRGWFDMSLISRFGRQRADQLKLENRRTYQDLIFEGLGFEFQDDRYVLPAAVDTGLRGDVALSPVAGPVWPMKGWDFYTDLQAELVARGLRVNVLPTRPTLLEHLGDVQGHSCLVSGDSLPMHLALGSGVRCVSLFNCTSPWEIHDYGLMQKLVSPLLAEHFYQRRLDPRATAAITLEKVVEATLAQLHSSACASVSLVS